MWIVVFCSVVASLIDGQTVFEARKSFRLGVVGSRIRWEPFGNENRLDKVEALGNSIWGLKDGLLTTLKSKDEQFGDNWCRIELSGKITDFSLTPVSIWGIQKPDPENRAAEAYSHDRIFHFRHPYNQTVELYENPYNITQLSAGTQKMCAVTSDGQVLHRSMDDFTDGSKQALKWTVMSDQQIPSMKKVSLGKNGQVWGISDDRQVYKLNNETNRFTKATKQPQSKEDHLLELTDIDNGVKGVWGIGWNRDVYFCSHPCDETNGGWKKLGRGKMDQIHERWTNEPYGLNECGLWFGIQPKNVSTTPPEPPCNVTLCCYHE